MTRGVALEGAVVLSLGEWAASDDPSDVLVCLGLGSCVALCLYDPLRSIGGMAHMVLPDSSARGAKSSGAKFVDVAVPLLLREMEAKGAGRARLRAHLIGGALMLQGAAFKATVNIGQRNAQAARAARAALRSAGVRVRGEELGGSNGRTVRLELATGRLTAATAGQASHEL